MKNTPLRTVREAASILGVSETWIYSRTAARSIPHTRLGGHVRFTDADLAAIVSGGATPPATSTDGNRPTGRKRRAA